MVKITYDEDNTEQRKLVEDYFWFKYYLEVIEFDILKNEYIMKDIFKCGYRKFSWTNTIFYDDKEQISIITKIESILNKIEMQRFIDIVNFILNYYYDYNLDKNISLIDCIKEVYYEGDYLAKIYKSYLIENFGDKN